MLTLKTQVQFIFESKKECEDFKITCLKGGISATDSMGKDYFYPSRRINQVEIYQTEITIK